MYPELPNVERAMPALRSSSGNRSNRKRGAETERLTQIRKTEAIGKIHPERMSASVVAEMVTKKYTGRATFSVSRFRPWNRTRG
jgi:hypothetical protein